MVCAALNVWVIRVAVLAAANQYGSRVLAGTTCASGSTRPAALSDAAKPLSDSGENVFQGAKLFQLTRSTSFSDQLQGAGTAAPNASVLQVQRRSTGIGLVLGDQESMQADAETLRKSWDFSADAIKGSIGSFVAITRASFARAPSSAGLLATMARASVTPHFLLVVCFAIACKICFVLILQMLICQAVKESIQSYDTTVLGVDIDIGSVACNIFTGRIVVHECRVHNVDGYKEAYLMTMDKFTFDLAVLRFVTTLGKEILIEKLHIQNVDTILEYKGGIFGIGGKSNFHVVLDTLKKWSGADFMSKVDVARVMEAAKETKSVAKVMKNYKVIIMSLAIIDIGAKVSLDGHGLRNALADIRFDDFQQECASGLVEDIIAVVFRSVAKSVLASVVGKDAADKKY